MRERAAPKLFTFAHIWVFGRNRLRVLELFRFLGVTVGIAGPAEFPTRRRLNLLEPRLSESHTTVFIPLNHRVIFVRLLNRAEFPGRLSEVA